MVGVVGGGGRKEGKSFINSIEHKNEDYCNNNCDDNDSDDNNIDNDNE